MNGELSQGDASVLRGAPLPEADPARLDFLGVPPTDRPRSISVLPLDRREPGVRVLEVLPRKEVIQPHLPVQLPCYDFVPVTSPTLGAYLPCGLAQRLQVLPTSMT